jgi:hypothetical protein
VVDFTQYQAPGVYVEDTSRPLVTSAQQVGSLAVLIGPGRGYQQVTEVLLAYSTPASAVPFGHLGAFKDPVVGPPAIAEPVVRDAAGTLLVRGDDYQFSVSGTGATAQVFITRLADDVDQTNVAVASPGGVVDGGTFTVSYNYADSAYYTPLVYEEFDGIANVYGEPFVSTSSAVNSPISLAAKVAFENGAGRLMVLPTDPADGDYKDQLIAAYAKVVTDYRAGMIVPLFVHGYTTDDGGGDSTSDTNDATAVGALITDVLSHVNAATADGFGRIAFIGLDAAYDQTTGGFDTLAVNAASKRIVLVYPPKINLYNSTANETIEASGYYLAAALTGILAGQSVERGLTRSIVSSFVSLPSVIFQAMTKLFKDTLSGSGVTVVETDRLQRLSVRHGVTTDMSSIDTREISLVRIADTLYQSVQFGMDNSGLIGEPIDEEMPSRVKGSLVGILEQAIQDDVIVSWDGLQVRQQSLPGGDPTVIECKFSYKPAVPLNYITVQFQIDLQTGLLDFQDDTLGSGSEGATV